MRERFRRVPPRELALPGTIEVGTDVPEAARLPGIARIAVLRAGGLGDFVFALPAMFALREAYPAAEITVLCGPVHAALAEGRPGPWDVVEVVPPFPGVRDGGQGGGQAERRGENGEDIEAFFGRMRARQFDLVVQMHGGGRNSNPFALALGGRITLGCRTPDAAPLDIWMPHVFLHSEVTRWLELVAMVGARTTSPRLAIEVTPADRIEADSVVGPKRGLEVTLHPGAGSPRRRWPAERFASIGDRLAEVGARVFVIGATEERALTAEVAGRMTAPAVDLGGRLTIGALVGLYNRVDLHVGNDSGPAHLARAVAPRSLTLMWGPNMLTAGPIGPAGRHEVRLAWEVDCPDCGARLVEGGCEHESTLLREIEVDQVSIAVQALLESRSPGGAVRPTIPADSRL